MTFILEPFASVNGAALAEESFRDVKAPGTNFIDVNLDGADFTGADLEGTSWRGVSLVGTNFTGANLKGSNLYAVNATGALFYKADLRKVYLGNVCLESADLRHANIVGAELDQVSLKGANLVPITSDGTYIRYLEAEPYGAAYTSDSLQIGCQHHPIAAWFSMTPAQMKPLGPEAVEQWDKWKDFLAQQILGRPCAPTRDIR